MLVLRRSLRFVIGLSSLSASALLAAGPGGCSSDNDTATDAGTPDVAVNLPETSVSTPDASPADAATCDKHLAAGFTNAITSPGESGATGTQVSTVLDENDDPMFAWVEQGTTNQLKFMRWDPCAGAFTTPETIETDLRGIDTNTGDREVALGYDPSTKEIVIAYQKLIVDTPLNDAPTIWLASRKPTATAWSLELVSEDVDGDTPGAQAPAIAMNAGKIYVAYTQHNYGCSEAQGACDALWFLESQSTPPPASDAGTYDAGPPVHYFARTAPYAASTDSTRDDKVSVAVDSTGAPAVAFLRAPPSGGVSENSAFMFWRPGSTPVTVTTTNNVQNDAMDITLAFDGTKPRIAGHLDALGNDTYDLTFVASNDGVTWSAPVHIPRYGSDDTTFDSWLALDSAGHAAVAADINSSTGDVPNGNPFLSLSTDLTTWTSNGVDVGSKLALDAYSITAIYGKSRLKDKLVLAFYSNGHDTSHDGIWYWQDQ